MADQSSHVVLFPFPAQGHIIPFLSLATLLHYRKPSLTLTLISTPGNISSLRSTLPPNSPLRLHSLPFSSINHGLPPNVESTAELPVPLFIKFFEASKSLQSPFDEFISTIADPNSLCIISDIFFGWTVEVARKYKASHSVFLTMGAFGGSVYLSLWLNLPHTLTENDEFSLFEYPEVTIHRSQLPRHLLSANGKDPWSVFLQREFSLCYKTDTMLVNTVEELEPVGLGMLRKTFKIPVLPVGPLIRLPVSEEESCIIQWLDSHPPDSVLFISFGSQNTIQANQMMELAMGLEASGRPFIWVIRPPVGFDVKGEFKAEWLPEGFEERMERENTGLLVRGWAPQVSILRHESRGAFLSHCGWNSVLESLSHGVPVIAWAIGGDQFYNAMVLEDLGVCVELARGNMENSIVERERVEAIVNLVMGDNEKGREIRNRARDIREVLNRALNDETGSSVNGLAEFFQSVGMVVPNGKIE